LEDTTVHPLFLGQLAIDIANERVRDAYEQRLAVSVRRGAHENPTRPAGPLRRSLARVVASVSRGAATIALRLDRGVADRLLAQRSRTADA
jgi:hypothetical protein